MGVATAAAIGWGPATVLAIRGGVLSCETQDTFPFLRPLSCISAPIDGKAGICPGRIAGAPPKPTGVDIDLAIDIDRQSPRHIQGDDAADRAIPCRRDHGGTGVDR